MMSLNLMFSKKALKAACSKGLQDLHSLYIYHSLKKKLYRYMDKAGLTVSAMKSYFSYYPDKLYKNLVETEVIFYDCRNLTRRNELK